MLAGTATSMATKPAPEPASCHSTATDPCSRGRYWSCLASEMRRNSGTGQDLAQTLPKPAGNTWDVTALTAPGCWMTPEDGAPGCQLHCGAHGLPRLQQQQDSCWSSCSRHWCCCSEGTAGLRAGAQGCFSPGDKGPGGRDRHGHSLRAITGAVEPPEMA